MWESWNKLSLFIFILWQQCHFEASKSRLYSFIRKYLNFEYWLHILALENFKLCMCKSFPKTSISWKRKSLKDNLIRLMNFETRNQHFTTFAVKQQLVSNGKLSKPPIRIKEHCMLFYTPPPPTIQKNTICLAKLKTKIHEIKFINYGLKSWSIIHYPLVCGVECSNFMYFPLSSELQEK